MPLTILVPMVVLGIAGIALLAHLLGLSQRKRFENEAAVEAAWLREYPKEVPKKIILSENRQAALVRTGQGPGVIWSMGSDFAARLLTPDRYSLNADTRRVTITTADITAPRIVLTLSKTERRVWFDILGEPHS